MSVLIKGMEMPKNCSTCPCFQYNMFDDDIDGYCKMLKTKITDSDKHYPNCQLVEIKTPHGRLIDADVLKQSAHLDGQVKTYIDTWIDSQEAVIEAERDENEY